MLSNHPFPPCPRHTTVAMTTFLTPNRHGYNVRFSPYDPDRLVVATSQYYGLAGGGTLFVLRLLPGGGALVESRSLTWTDGLFDVAWSEQNADCVVSASGDGGLQLWNIGSAAATGPKMCYREHTKEVYSVDWSRARDSPQMLSASWDCTIRLWDPVRTQSLSTYRGHAELVYSAKFAPLMASTFASVGGDGLLKLWSTQSARPVAWVKAHDAEVSVATDVEIVSHCCPILIAVTTPQTLRCCASTGANTTKTFWRPVARTD